MSIDSRPQPSLGLVRRLRLSAALCAGVALAACGEGSTPSLVGPSGVPAGTSRNTYICTVALTNPGSPTLQCVPSGAAGATGTISKTPSTTTEDLVLGNQGVNVRLNLSNFAFNVGTRVFSMNASVTNLLTQPIGTTDGSTTTPTAVRIYMTYGPVASGGFGTITLNNPDGTALFMGNTVPYYQYSPFIKAQATSANKSWQFGVAVTAQGFAFQVEVDAAVPAPNSVLLWTVLRQGLQQNQLNSVWQNTASDIWAVGAGSTILHNNGGLWSIQAAVPAGSYNSVWGTSGTDVWAVGNGGVVSHYDGTTWTAGTSGSARNLNGVWGSVQTNYYAAGNTGTGLHLSGTTWSTISFGFAVSGNLHAVWGADASHVYMVGDNGQILFFNGTSWSKLASPTVRALSAIWGTSATNIYAVGALGTIIDFDGVSWTTQVSNTTSQLSGVGGTGAGDVWAVGSGVTQHFNGTSWNTIAPVAGMLVTSIASASSYPLWAVGGGGALLVVAGTQFRLSSQAGIDILAVWASSATNVWASSLGTMLHYNGTNWTSAYVSANDSMRGIWGTGPTNVYSVGRSGTIAHFDGTSWTSATVNPSSPPFGYNGIYGSSNSDIWAVGQGGLVAHYNGTAWSFPARTGSGNLTGVWGGGSPFTYFTSASDGTAWRYPTGGPWTAVTFNPANTQGLFGVFGTSATDIWVTGNAGTAYVDTTGTFVHPTPANGLATNFNGVWNTSTSDVYLVGAGGTVQHFNGSVWLQMSSPVATLLNAIYGTAAQNVYVVGRGGVVLLGTGP